MKCTILSFLNTFYKTDAGQLLASDVASSITGTLHKKDEKILVIGFDKYYLDKLDNGNLYYAIPKYFSVNHWPKIRPFKAVVVEEDRLPFQSNTWDVVIVTHFMEFDKNNNGFLDEIFRILKTNGKFIVIAINKQNNIYNNMLFSKALTKKVIKLSVMDIIDVISESQFHINSIWGINKKFRFWPCSFNYKFNKYNEMLISIFPLFSDVIVISAQKMEFSPEALKTLNPQYEI